MILKASQRGNARELAKHLLNGHNNEHVTVHDVRGFVSETVEGALQEAYAISRGTRCRQFLFSLSLNPPDNVDAPIEVFEDAIAEIEDKLGLTDQPRIIVFHEKKGRRHCHVIWSRIKADTMTALNMAHFKYKLMDISKGLFLKHKWTLPKGFRAKMDKDKTTYTQDEWQQARRMKDQPDKLKAFFKSCWERSDSKTSFAAALQEYGLYLAKGDRRGYVAIDMEGEVYSLTRWLNLKTKELKAKLGRRDDLPSLDQARDYIKARLNRDVADILARKRELAKQARAPIVTLLRDLTIQQRRERDALIDKQQSRWRTEHRARSSRINHGLSGVLDKISGRYQRIRSQNEREVIEALQRDRAEQHAQVKRHLRESKTLHDQLSYHRDLHYEDTLRIKREVAGFINAGQPLENTSKSQPKYIDIVQELQSIAAKINAVAGDIFALESSMGHTNISDDLKAELKSIIERVKEAFTVKKQAELDRREYRQEQALKLDQLIAKQRMLYQLIQRQEELKHKQQSQIKYNQFYQIVMRMSYDLNGQSRYAVKLAEPHQFTARLSAYQQGLKRTSNTVLESQLKTSKKADKIEDGALALSTGAMTVKEALRRSGKLKSRAQPQPTIKRAPITLDTTKSSKFLPKI